MSNIPIPFMGDALEFVKRVKAEPDRAQLTRLMFDFFPDEVPSCIGMFWPHGLELLIADPVYY